jgi:hypothetical protein
MFWSVLDRPIVGASSMAGRIASGLRPLREAGHCERHFGRTDETPGDLYLQASGEGGGAGLEILLVSLVVALLVAIGAPMLLKTTGSLSSTGAKANLTNAFYEAKSLYENSQSYSVAGAADATIAFDAQGPGFEWSTGSCAGQSSDCVSEQVLDVNTPGDAQGLILATWSATNKTCLYAVDLESVPRPIVSDSSGVPFETRAGALHTAGLFYATSRAGASSCVAAQAIEGAQQLNWSTS